MRVTTSNHTSDGPIVTTNGSETVEGADGPVVVEQGPDWLVTVLYNPPDWLFPLVVLVTVVVVGGAALAVRRHGEDVLEAAGPEMAQNFGIVVGVIACTRLSMAWLSLSYVGDVVVGWSVGSVLGIGGAIALGLVFDDLKR